MRSTGRNDFRLRHNKVCHIKQLRTVDGRTEVCRCASHQTYGDKDPLTVIPAENQVSETLSGRGPSPRLRGPPFTAGVGRPAATATRRPSFQAGAADRGAGLSKSQNPATRQDCRRSSNDSTPRPAPKGPSLHHSLRRPPGMWDRLASASRKSTASPLPSFWLVPFQTGARRRGQKTRRMSIAANNTFAN
jgi:hypothetical protein